MIRNVLRTLDGFVLFDLAVVNFYLKMSFKMTQNLFFKYITILKKEATI